MLKFFSVGDFKDNNKKAFTLTEVLLAVLIVGIISGLVLPAVVNKVKDDEYEIAYKREIQSIQNAIDALVINENKTSFFETSMYNASAPANYDKTKTFLKKYFKVVQMCDTGSDCFAEKYYQYNASGDKVVYTPTFSGACAKLRNGTSLCLVPQVGASGPTGYIDVNGEKGPNILGKDLRAFGLTAKTQEVIAKNTDSMAEVISTDFNPLNPCAGKTCGCGDLPPCGGTPGSSCAHPHPNDASKCCDPETTPQNQACCDAYPGVYAKCLIQAHCSIKVSVGSSWVSGSTYSYHYSTEISGRSGTTDAECTASLDPYKFSGALKLIGSDPTGMSCGIQNGFGNNLPVLGCASVIGNSYTASILLNYDGTCLTGSGNFLPAPVTVNVDVPFQGIPLY